MVSALSFSSLVLAAALSMSRSSAIDIPDTSLPTTASFSDVTVSVNFPDSIPAIDLKYYKAEIMPLGNSTVKGTVYVKADPFHTGTIVYGGHLAGLQANLVAETCNATNGCGVHIHSGFSCNSTATQLGHFYNNMTIPSDPWATQRYSSNGYGISNFASHVDLGTTDVNGRAFIVHNSTGARVACGLLVEQTFQLEDQLPPPVTAIELKYYKASIVPLGNATVKGTVYVKVDPFHTDSIVYGGHLVGLQANLMAETCNATNGCGVHIHSGFSCNSTATQLGHLFNNLTIPTDPWATQRYSSDKYGISNFANRVALGTTDVNGRVFIVHNSTGARVACGILQEQTIPIEDVTMPSACKGVSGMECTDNDGNPGIFLSKKLNRQYRSKTCKQECISASSDKDPSWLIQQRGWSCGPCPRSS